MKTRKQLGIWMDYAAAHVMELNGESINTSEVKSNFTWEEKQHSFFKGEKLMHKKEKHLVDAYFKQIANHISGFDDVVLFGPGESKTELFNVLTTDKQFRTVNLHVKAADKMTENQRKAFLKDYFQPTAVHS